MREFLERFLYFQMAHQAVQAPGGTDSEYIGSASLPNQNRHWRSAGGIQSLLWQLLILKL